MSIDIYLSLFPLSFFSLSVYPCISSLLIPFPSPFLPKPFQQFAEPRNLEAPKHQCGTSRDRPSPITYENQSHTSSKANTSHTCTTSNTSHHHSNKTLSATTTTPTTTGTPHATIRGSCRITRGRRRRHRGAAGATRQRQRFRIRGRLNARKRAIHKSQWDNTHSQKHNRLI